MEDFQSFSFPLERITCVGYVYLMLGWFTENEVSSGRLEVHGTLITKGLKQLEMQLKISKSQK